MFHNQHNCQQWDQLPHMQYEAYQENGTKYLRTLSTMTAELYDELSCCAGELFITGIPANVRPEQIGVVAALLGELYILRFKVNFAGESRGFAYMQYMNASLMPLALERLPELFRQHALPMICVRQSYNISKLVLKKTYCMAPHVIYDMLRSVVTFLKLVGREVYHDYFEYQIVFRSNDDAVHARRELLRCVAVFGPHAIVLWDTRPSNLSTKFGAWEWLFQPRTLLGFGSRFGFGVGIGIGVGIRVAAGADVRVSGCCEGCSCRGNGTYYTANGAANDAGDDVSSDEEEHALLAEQGGRREFNPYEYNPMNDPSSYNPIWPSHASYFN